MTFRRALPYVVIAVVLVAGVVAMTARAAARRHEAAAVHDSLTGWTNPTEWVGAPRVLASP
jgi:hypothetical protein